MTEDVLVELDQERIALEGPEALETDWDFEPSDTPTTTKEVDW